MASLLTGTTIAANIALHAGNVATYALPIGGGTLASTNDQILTLNKSSGTGWGYIGFSQAGTRRFYFGLNGSFEPELGVDNGGTFRVIGGMTVAGNAVLTSTSTLTAGNLSGTIPSGVLGNSTLYVGSTAIALNRASAAQTLTGVNIDGYANYISAQTNPIGVFNVGLTRPKGASYTTTASSVTGAIKIKMPPGIPVHGMWKMTIKIYEYGARGNGYTIECGCHLYPSTAYNRYQYAIGVDSNIALTIRYGTDGTSGCIWIGENATTWSYPQIHVTEFSNGFNNPGNPDWNAGTWGVTIGTIDNSVAVDGPYTIGLPLASTATTLQTARLIGGVSFNGSADITLPGVNSGGNQNTSGSSASCTGNAATATILQTGRTINGTSFNGSAAITTANWGTARTLTIGSTGKSVDGSAAVSWSLAELGAAATNQTMFVGTTSIAINRASASQTLTGVSIDGNAATATILATGRLIGGVSFNGSADITLPGVNTGGTQNTTGTSSNITAYTINQSVGSTNSPTFATLQLTRLNFGATGAAPYGSAAGEGTGNGITFGGDEAGAGYRIFTGMENIGGNYSKLTLNWHTGIRIGAYTGYGGIRFYNNSVGTGTEIFSVGNTDNNVRVVNSLIVNGITINQERATNARMYGTTTGAFGLLGVDSAGSFRWQIYGDASSHGFLDSTWGNWDIKKTINGELDLRVSSALVRVLNAGNYQNYALPLGGGTLTGGLTITNLFGNANSASLYANTGTYGSWKIGGTRNGWYGIEFESGTILMANSSESGFYRVGSGWQMWWSGGTGYVQKGGSGGGTQATILESSNYTSYTPGLGTNNTLTGINTITNTSNTVINNQSGNLGLTMLQATTGTDAYMTFHIVGDFAAYFGLGGAENDLVYGGWSVGNVRHRILHSGNAPYAWNMNQYVRTTDTCSFAGLTVSNTITGAVSGNAGTVTNGLYTTGGQTIAGITYFSNGESINAYGIRGRFTNEYLHLYNKVGVGHPSGWGQGETSTPDKGLSTYGGLNIAYGDNGISTFNGVIRANSNIRQGPDLAMPLASWSVAGTSTGMVIFSFPGDTSNYGMVHCVFDIYEYNSNTVSTVIVGGHNWNGAWYNIGANVIGRCGKSVRLGVKDSKYCVVFGGAASSWEYGTIILRKIHNGGFYTNVMDMGGSFTTQKTTTESFSNISGDLRMLRTSADFIADGGISGTTGTFSGGVSGTTGVFSGGISGTTGTFSSDLSSVGNYQIRNGDPTITFRDTDHRTAYIHVNSNVFHILSGVADSAFGNWNIVANGRWPLEINLSNNNATFGADVNAISFTGSGSGLTGTAASLTVGAVPWSGITSKPTTFSGYGISDLIYGSTGSRNVWTITNWNQTTYPNAHFLSSEGSTTNAPSTDFIYGLQTAFHRDGASYRTQMVSELYSSPVSIWVRNSRDSDVWTAWSKLLHSNNYSSYALPLGGGTLTGALNGTTASFSGTVDATQFRDRDDVSYYLDPAGTSNLNKLSTFTMSYNDMNSMHTQSPYVTRYNQGAQYRNGTMGSGTTDCNVMFSNWGSGFIDSWSSPANGPGGSSHYVGLQAFHYNHQNSVNAYGFQMLCAGEADNRFFWRSAWPTLRSWVEMIHSGNITANVLATSGTAASLSIGGSSNNSGSLYSDTGNVGGSRLQYWQAANNATLNPDAEYYNAIRMGHGDPVAYYSNTIAVKMTGSNLGDIYTRTTTNGTAGTWNRFWNNNNDGSGSGLDADLLDGYNSATANTANTIVLRDASGNFSANIVDATQFRDSNNTAYYLDPASTSILNRINLNTAATAYMQWRSAGQGTMGGGFPFYNNVSYGSINIEVSDNDTGGLVIDNEGVTVYGAGDNGEVFRVIDEDVYQSNSNITLSRTFWINQGLNGGGGILGPFSISGTATASSFTGAGTGLTGTAASLTIGGNAANVTGTVAIANGGTGATTAAAARTNLGIPNSYLYAKRTTNQTIASGVWAYIDIIFSTNSASSGIAYNTSTGVASLTAGKVYRITAGLEWNRYASANSFSVGWNLCNNADNSVISPEIYSASSTWYLNSSNNPTLDMILAPSSNIDVKIRTINNNGYGTDLVLAGNNYFIIQQIA